MNIINRLAGVWAFAVLGTTFSVAAGAEGYDIRHFWASGDNWTVLFSEDHQPTDEHFSVVHDEVAQAVTFTFSGDSVRNGSCTVGIDSVDGSQPVAHVYHKAVELAENIDRVKSFHVRKWAVCFDIQNIQYREDLTTVEFNCEDADTYWGQSVYVVGDTQALGNWDPAKAVKLDADFYPDWRKSLVVENNQDIEWKCLKREQVNVDAGIEWEPGENHRFNSAETNASWGRF